ncbi:FkbM family methyltransferase [Pseudomonas sp. CGJS7]|uniref:FkbM family methyltransferase n=1 Tax=Pseudomonas sp. CGJS7 TaxID=3109348 RepID=UPI0030086BF3
MIKAKLTSIARHVYPFGRLLEQRDNGLRHISLLTAELTDRENALTQLRSELDRSQRHTEAMGTEADPPGTRLAAENQRLERERLELLGELTRCNATIETLQGIPKRGQYERPAFAHWGEDQVAAHFLGEVESGFYVDLGCYHPRLCSNTKLLHERGWSGINVDANPFMIQEFERDRPNDTNLNIAIGAERGQARFRLFHDWASSNTTSAEFADYIAKREGIDIAREITTEVYPLRDILERHGGDRRVDFLNIDIESVDIQALESNDWQRYRPALLAIEDFDFEFATPDSSPIYRYLIDQGYDMVSRCVFTSFFIDATLPADDPVYKHHATRPGTRKQ